MIIPQKVNSCKTKSKAEIHIVSSVGRYLGKKENNIPYQNEIIFIYERIFDDFIIISDEFPNIRTI